MSPREPLKVDPIWTKVDPPEERDTFIRARVRVRGDLPEGRDGQGPPWRPLGGTPANLLGVTKATGPGLDLTARCAGCGRDVPDWEERTEGTGEPVAKLQTEDGGGFLVETETGCQGCGNTRVRVAFRLG